MRDIGVITALGSPAIAGKFHTLVLQPTSFCNLDCTYCYLPNRRSRRLMSVPVATACARSIEQQQDSGHPVSVVWHGGEPTSTPIGIFRELLASFEPLRNTGQVLHEIQTNATLINQRWCDLLATHDFGIGISIDGPGTLNGIRLDRAGRATTARTMRGLQTLADAGLTYSVICVVTPETIDHADDFVEFFAGLPGCESVGFNIEEQEGADRLPVSEEAAYRFWHQIVRYRLAGSPLRIRDVDRLADYLAATRAGLVDHVPYEPIPTVSHDGQVVLLSPELLGIKDPRYADFIAGNVLHEPIGDMLADARELRYVTEFVTALNDCAVACPPRARTG
ncbi:cyclophane-forming radical SAM peptide maturase AmcB [Verrucosispora sp. WMMC514]|uniref:cyclophane-forming radical SAM peptide maturase AmcB n=1 Tax=Verrucosispora sp. WMMC514 TaxID=3015156 RepID=UPI00248AF9B2|nr:cyclophane-forming radical SAM peptide maturase AmcB [Verrucosispora sp. WMMC514]WBB94552.1 radical SAM protein [Verrucosispora sp. WMMC514]